MKLVVDANVLFAVLIKEGKNEDLIFNHNFEIFAPNFLFEEFKKYKAFLLKKTEREESDFNKLLDILKKRIKTILDEDIKLLEEAKQISPDLNDVDYFALALKLNCPIWSNDKKLKEQNRVRIYSTEDLVNLDLRFI